MVSLSLNALLKFFVPISLGLFTILLLLYLYQSKFIYPAPKEQLDIVLPEHISKYKLGLSHAFLLRPDLGKKEATPLMIFTHGNAELASDWLNDFKPILESNIAVLVVEYPGYDGSTAQTNFKTINQTILEAYDLVSNLPAIDENKIFAYGRSIGGGVAALLAKQRPLSALCLESTFSSLPKLVSEKGLPSFLLKERYENEEIIKKLDIPIFLYHGVNDRLIPFAHAESLVDAGKNITFYQENCGHNDCPRKWNELLDFLKVNNLD